MSSPIGCAVLGYGPRHNFGWAHAKWIQSCADLRLVAIADVDPERAAAAQEAFPEVRTCTDPNQLFANDEVQLVSIVTPHFTHCPLTVAAFNAGKHVVVEKAMCLNVAEATAMIEAGRKAGRTLAIHHNRRHDGNYRRVVDVVRSGVLGEVFDIELYAGGYWEPQNGWYRMKATSGGGFYYWGPHAVDWVLSLVPSRVVSVDGYFHKRVWHAMTNEDQVSAKLRFENGVTAEITWSTIAAAGKPLWRILGTKGALVDSGHNATPGYQYTVDGPSGGSLKVITVDGERREEELPYFESDWATYWQDLADHLLGGGPVPVSGEFGRRVIGVFEAAEKSSDARRTEPLAYEEEYWAGVA